MTDNVAIGHESSLKCRNERREKEEEGKGKKVDNPSFILTTEVVLIFSQCVEMVLNLIPQ